LFLFFKLVHILEVVHQEAEKTSCDIRDNHRYHDIVYPVHERQYTRSQVQV